MRVLLVTGSLIFSLFFAQLAKASTSFDISDVTLIGTTPSSLSFSFRSSQPGTTQSAYGINSRYGSLTLLTDSSVPVVSHSVTVQDLLPCTVYSVKLISNDQLGNHAEAIFADHATTSGCIGDAAATFQDSIYVPSNNPASTISIQPSNLQFSSVTLNIPDTFVSTPTTVQLVGLNANKLNFLSTQTSGNTILLGSALQLRGLTDDLHSVDVFSMALTVQATFLLTALAGVNPSSLHISRWDPTNRSWKEAPGCVLSTFSTGPTEANQGKISCTILSSSLLALMGLPLVAGAVPIDKPASANPPTIGGFPVTGMTFVIPLALISSVFLIMYLSKKVRRPNE